MEQMSEDSSSDTIDDISPNFVVTIRGENSLAEDSMGVARESEIFQAGPDLSGEFDPSVTKDPSISQEVPTPVTDSTDPAVLRLQPPAVAAMDFDDYDSQKKEDPTANPALSFVKATEKTPVKASLSSIPETPPFKSPLVHVDEEPLAAEDMRSTVKLTENPVYEKKGQQLVSPEQPSLKTPLVIAGGDEAPDDPTLPPPERCLCPCCDVDEEEIMDDAA